MTDHIIVIHRWTDNYADYAAYVDHGTHHVSYITTRRASGGLPDGAAAVRIVDSTEDGAQVRAAVSAVIGEFGPPDRIIALQEIDLDMAAELREELGVAGERLTELAPFRDKLAMAEKLAAAGVPVPATRSAPDQAAVRDFAAVHGWPVLIKPVRGTASAGVTIFRSAEELAAYKFRPDVPMLVQPYLTHEILHVDGVITEDGLGAWQASRYLNTCFDFTEGVPLGSADLDDPKLTIPVGEFTAQALRALTTEPRVFHLELFLSGSPGAPELTVLEVAERPGGADIPFVLKEVHGMDLMAVTFAIQAGTPLPAIAYSSPEPGGTEYGGWLLVPTPAARPCRVTAANSQLGRDGGPYAEHLPVVGQTLADIPGYEHAGARFRFRAGSTAEVEAAIGQTLRDLNFRATTVSPDVPERVVVIGSGGRAYREYAFAALADRQLYLAVAAEPTWQLDYLAGHSTAADTSIAAMTQAVAECITDFSGPVGALTWDEPSVEVASAVAWRLGLPHMSPAAARNCRDKLATRRLMRAAGLPAVRFAHVSSLEQALRAADGIGYPVVLKPRSLAASVGVVIAQDPDELRTVYHHALDATYPGLGQLDGLVLEEFLEGPEISVDSIVCDGDVQLANVARKRLGFHPFFEEVGHLVSPWRDEPWADDLTALITGTHQALDVRTGVTHAEVRLTPAGPRLVELNARLGGDFIPYLGQLATGVDLTRAAMDLALGRVPDTRATRNLCAEVRFLYPPHDGVIRSLDVSAVTNVAGAEVFVLAAPGTTLQLPPRGIVPRLAALIVTGDTPQACQDALDKASSLVQLEVEPTETAGAPS
ncbi:MAG TPA: ATP-grasp domain-containing protein [Trebonia sp.]|nr:ATP-grasp domain-containing protein [Trebonia sp.]